MKRDTIPIFHKGLIGLLIIFSLFLAFAPIIFLYVESDIVECNFFFCKFQTLKNDSLDIVQVCTLNGDPTNCTELHKNWIGEIP